MLFKKLIPALWWALLILLLCFLPGSAIPELTFLDWLKPDKLVHLFLFGVLSFLMAKGFASQETNGFLQNFPKLIAVLISSVYGAIIEVIQEFCIPGRNGDVYDSLADSLGAIIGIWIFLI